MSRAEHFIYLLLGSNIEPESNLPQSVTLLRKRLTVVQTSSVWESQAIGSAGPNFLNAALLARTPLDPDSLKERVLRPLEALLGRVRTEDKNAARTIDIDPILFDQKVLDPLLWNYAHIAVPLSELVPCFKSEGGELLKDIASRLAAATPLWVRDDLSDYPFTTVFQEFQ